MQGAENVLLDQGVMGAIIVLLTLAVAALWLHNNKQSKEMRADLCKRNDALTLIMEETIQREHEISAEQIERSRQLNITLTLLINLIREMEAERERVGQD